MVIVPLPPETTAKTHWAAIATPAGAFRARDGAQRSAREAPPPRLPAKDSQGGLRGTSMMT